MRKRFLAMLLAAMMVVSLAGCGKEEAPAEPVMEPEPVFRAVKSVEGKIGGRPRVVYMTPQAQVLDQTKVESLAQEKNLIILCGHYEGIDERVLQETVTDYISIGDYVLTGGELGALVLIDAVSRFVPGVLSNE